MARASLKKTKKRKFQNLKLSTLKNVKTAESL